jgi:protein-disulfide isomerase
VKLTKVTLTIVVVLGMIAAVLGAKALVMEQRVDIKKPVALGKTFGVMDARVQVEEFTDFQCPACANASMMLHEEMKKEGTKIFVELNYFPLSMHKHARRAAIVAQCALLQSKFWSMQDMLFRTQEVWSIVEDPTDYFLSLARGIGLDEKLMMRCMSDKATEAIIDADVAEGRRRGVGATPTFFINGKMAVGGPNFQAALKEALK